MNFKYVTFQNPTCGFLFYEIIRNTYKPLCINMFTIIFIKIKKNLGLFPKKWEWLENYVVMR